MLVLISNNIFDSRSSFIAIPATLAALRRLSILTVFVIGPPLARATLYSTTYIIALFFILNKIRCHLIWFIVRVLIPIDTRNLMLLTNEHPIILQHRITRLFHYLVIQSLILRIIPACRVHIRIFFINDFGIQIIFTDFLLRLSLWIYRVFRRSNVTVLLYRWFRLILMTPWQKLSASLIKNTSTIGIRIATQWRGSRHFGIFFLKIIMSILRLLCIFIKKIWLVVLRIFCLAVHHFGALGTLLSHPCHLCALLLRIDPINYFYRINYWMIFCFAAVIFLLI